MTLHDEEIDENEPYELFDPEHTWKRKTVSGFTAKKLLCKIFDRGKLCYEEPNLSDIKKYCAEQIDTMWDEVLRFDNPHEYYVDMSQDLWELKNNMLRDVKSPL